MTAIVGQAKLCLKTNVLRSSDSRQPAACKAVLPRFNGMRASFTKQDGLLELSAKPSTSFRTSGLKIVAITQMEAGVGVMGNKAGMTQIFTEAGDAVGVTVVTVHDGNIVTQVKKEEDHGYNAVQVGYRVNKEYKVAKPQLGHIKKAGDNLPAMKHLEEFRVQTPEQVEAYEPGQQLEISEMFSEGDLVDVRGTSIGKGFQGGIKRHGFKRGLMTHGSKSHRQHGSCGPGTYPGRMYPGLKMAGRMGGKTVKIQKLEVMRVDKENQCLLIKGGLPGKPGNLLRITPAKQIGKNVFYNIPSPKLKAQ